MPLKPSDAEEEYFKKEEVERLKKTRRDTLELTVGKERERLKELHWMRCPKCGMELAEIDYRGFAVDACFSCGGMFLDKGEMEKVAEWEEPTKLQNMLQGLFDLRKT